MMQTVCSVFLTDVFALMQYVEAFVPFVWVHRFVALSGPSPTFDYYVELCQLDGCMVTMMLFSCN